MKMSYWICALIVALVIGAGTTLLDSDSQNPRASTSQEAGQVNTARAQPRTEQAPQPQPQPAMKTDDFTPEVPSAEALDAMSTWWSQQALQVQKQIAEELRAGNADGAEAQMQKLIQAFRSQTREEHQQVRRTARD